MKTNKILMAVALPTLLAACTAEEFDQVSVQEQTLANRALLNPNFAINVANVESRFAWENAEWEYEAGDKFGAAITDVATQWSVSDNSMFGNYIFAKNEAGNYVTDSQMGEGVYMLYSYNDFETKMARSLVAFDLTNQVCDLDDPAAEINKYENQLMFTPLYKLEEKYSTEAMAPTFYSYYGVGAFKFKNNSGQDLKITQIILKHTDGNMVVKGRVSQAAFANAAQYVYNESKEDYVLSGVHAALENGDLSTAERNAAIEDAEKAFEETIYKATAAISADAAKGEKESSFITLDTQNYLLEDGEEKTAYMFVPAGYEGFEVEIMVVDEEGETWSVYANAEGKDKDGNSDTKGIKVTGMDKLELQRHKGNMIFGKSSDGKTMKTLNIKEENLSENSGYYVDSKAAMLELLDANLGDIKVHNSGDWAIDAEIVEAIIDYTGANIEFSNPITIKSAKALTNNDEWELALSGVEFDDLTVIGEIKEGKTVLFEGTTVELENVKVNGTLTVQAGANVTIKDGSVSRATGYPYGKIENEGTLTVEMEDRVSGKGISNYGALTIVGGQQYVDAYAGTIEYVTEVVNEANVPYTVESKTLMCYGEDYNVTVTVAEDVTFKLNSEFVIKGNDDMVYTFVNSGTFDLNGKTLIVNGVLTNNNVIENGAVTVAGTLTNNKTLEAATTVNAKATLNNNGEAKSVATNNGDIVTGADSKTTVEAGEGRINNTNEAQVSANAAQTVFYTVNNKAVEDLETILFKRYAINTLRVEGTLTMDRPFGKDAMPEQLAVLETLELAKGAEVKVDGDVHTSFANVVVEGNAKISGWSKAESSLTFDQDVKVTLMQKSVTNSNSKGYVLTIEDVKVAGTKIEFEAKEETKVTDHVAYVKPEIKLVDAVMTNHTYDSNVEAEGNVVEVTAGTSATENGNALKNAINVAKAGEEIVLAAGEYDVNTNNTGIDKAVTIIAEEGTEISTGEEKDGTRFEIDLDEIGTVVLKNLKVGKNGKLGNLWLKACKADGYRKVVLENVECNNLIYDNGYHNNDVIDVEVINCKINKVDMKAYTGNINTYNYLTYNDASTIESINADENQTGGIANIKINGVTPTVKGEQIK